MSSRSAKPSKNPNPTVAAKSSPVPISSSLSSHLAMVELKHRILTTLNKLADRDTHQIAVEDLENMIESLSNDGIPMFLNCLYDAVNDPKAAVKKEGVRLLAVLCAAHTDPAASHLTKIIAHIMKRVKDTDSQVRDACRDTIGSLAGLYVKGGNGGDGVVSLFVKPLFEVMGENNKVAQGGAALCLAKMIECAAEPPLTTFQKLCSRVCKYLNSPNFVAKASMLQVVSSLSQVGAITPQSLEPLMQSVHGCLGSSDWATRKAAAETLSIMGSHLDNISAEVAVSTVHVLEASRFDKVKPVRECMTETLQLWKKIAGKGDGHSDSHASEADINDHPNLGENEKSVKSSSCGSSPTCKSNGILDKAVGILKKKAPALTDKELNPEFFQKLETRVSVPVEVILPRRGNSSSNSQNEEELETNGDQSNKARLKCPAGELPLKGTHESREWGIVGDRTNVRLRESSSASGQLQGSADNKTNLLAIQRQLLLLERQQAHVMNMLKEFMGGSSDSMVTLETRVMGLERVVEDMARGLSISSGWSGGSTSNRSFSKYNGISDYSSGRLGRGNDGRSYFGDRFSAFDGVSSGMKSRGPSWRSDISDVREFQGYGRNGYIGSRRAAAGGPDSEADQVGSRRAWEKRTVPVRLGEGPSARSVWQASKDEATLAAIRDAGEDSGVTGSARVALPEMTAEALLDDSEGLRDRDPVWTCWRNAMDALHAGDMDSAFAEVLPSGDDFLLVKLMERTGPVIDQLSDEVASEVVNAVSELVMEQKLFDLCLNWIQQLADIVTENGGDVLGIPLEVKRQLLLNLHEALSSCEDWEGSNPDQLIVQLASAWEIDLQRFGK